MDDSLVKARVTPTPTVTIPQKVSSEKAIPAEVKTDPSTELYATYSLDHETPFLADYYGIKDLWNNKDLTYQTEIDTIDGYLMQEIKDKQLENKTSSVKERLAKLENIAGIDPTTSTAMRLKKLAAYTQYMSKLKDINLGVQFNVQP